MGVNESWHDTTGQTGRTLTKIWNESWEARVCMRVTSTHRVRSNENKSCMRIDWILPRTWRKLSSNFEPVKSWWECNRVGGQTRVHRTLVARDSRIFRLIPDTRTSGNQGRVHRGLRWEFSLPARYNIQFTLISCTLILVWPGHHGPAWVEKTHMQTLARPPHTRETCWAITASSGG
jgi:hypothetical protein